MAERHLPDDWPRQREQIGRRLRRARLLEGDTDGRGGYSNPTVETLAALAHTLDLTLVDLLTDHRGH